MLLQCVDLGILFQKDRLGFTIEDNFNRTMFGEQRTIYKFTKKLAALRMTHKHSREVEFNSSRARLISLTQYFDCGDTDALRIDMFG